MIFINKAPASTFQKKGKMLIFLFWVLTNINLIYNIKIGSPIRTILSFRSASLYKIAKCLVKIILEYCKLNPLSSIQHFRELMREIKDIK